MNHATSKFANLIWTVLVLGALVVPRLAQAQTFTVIHDFLGAPNEPSFPASLVPVQGRDGNLYTQSYYGGTGNNGTIFRATPSGTIAVLRNNEAGCGPNWLSVGSDGNLYGACGPTSASPNGYIWQLTPGGTFTDLHDFNGSGDGHYPVAPLLATDGNLYGITHAGGANNVGTFYKRTPNGTLTTLYTFASGSNGYTPLCIPTQGSNGSFYCTTEFGGANGFGTVFSISSKGKFTLLHTFVGGASDGADGDTGVILVTDGNFYGVTRTGGASNQGTAFKMTAAGKVTLLHSFNGTSDGGYPGNGVTQGSDGNLYGTANDCSLGGCSSNWTAFKVTRTGVFTVLHTFNGGSDGALPDGGMLQLTNGIFYGVCEQGGNGNGTLWTVDTGLGPFVNLETTSGKEGVQIGILGQGFSNSSVVKFGGVAATTITVTGSTYISATVPAGALTGKVTVTTGGTTLTSPQTFKVLPTITSFTPTSGPAGTPVVITGTGLTQTTSVTFGGVKATTVIKNSDTQVTADVPTGAKTGKIGITTKGGKVTSKTSFTVN